MTYNTFFLEIIINLIEFDWIWLLSTKTKWKTYSGRVFHLPNMSEILRFKKAGRMQPWRVVIVSFFCLLACRWRWRRLFLRCIISDRPTKGVQQTLKAERIYLESFLVFLSFCCLLFFFVNITRSLLPRGLSYKRTGQKITNEFDSFLRFFTFHRKWQWRFGRPTAADEGFLSLSPPPPPILI